MLAFVGQIGGPVAALAQPGAGFAVDRAIHFPRSWNKTFLPKPFAKVVIYWLGPLPAVSREVDPRNPDLALELEAKLHGARQQAIKFIADIDA